MAANVLVKSAANGVTSVVLNRPEVHNAFDADTIQELTNILTEINSDSNIRLVLLKANGDNFSAGAALFRSKFHLV